MGFKGAGDKIKETGSNIGQGIKNAGKGVSQQVSDYFTNNLESIEAWEEWKDSIEELNIPESEVDNLADLTGNAFEEKRETYEEAKDQGMKSQRPIPCPECCKTIPKSLGNIAQTWPQIAGTCNIAANDDANLGN